MPRSGSWRSAGPAAFVLLCAASIALSGAASDTTSLDIARGRHIATALAGCADCHGTDFGGGRPFTRAGQTVFAANLTGGAGGVAAASDGDLARAIRTGIRSDGTRLQVMPSREYAIMTDADVNDLIAFLRSLRPVDRSVARGAAPAGTPSPVGQESPAERSGPLGTGVYLATIGGCTNCHAANLAGGARIGEIVAPDISHAGIGNWSFADFASAMRTGRTPDGRLLARVMPWESIGKMTDEELRSLYDFLESKPGGAS
jgi:cytochrome c553